MVCHLPFAFTRLLATMLCGGIIVTSNVNCSAMENDARYTHIVRVRDPERRQERLGRSEDDKRVDVTAFVGMPEAYSAVASEFVESALSVINAAPITRRRYYHRDRVRAPDDKMPLQPYPDAVNPVYDRDVIVPFVILPRPDAVESWSASNEARALGWMSDGNSVKNRGSVYGRTVIFEAGKRSKNPKSLPASPFETNIPSWDLYAPENDTTFFLELGKMVVTPNYDSPGRILMDHSGDLHLGEKEGAKLLGEIVTVPPYLQNSRLRWASIGGSSNARRFLAYSLLDGNGARRTEISEEAGTSSWISPYVRPLVCDRHQPRIKQHDALLLPTPMGWPPTLKAQERTRLDESAHEEWCLDDWFPAQKDACWVIREAEDSKPLQESFLLMPASEKSDRPVFFIALFAETEPKQLVKELAALYKVSPDKALNSPETMARLQALYEKIRDFPLDK